MRLNPYHPPYYFGHAALAHLLARRAEEAVALIERADGLPNRRHPGLLGGRLCPCRAPRRGAGAVRQYLANFREKIAFGRPSAPGDELRWFVDMNPLRRPEDMELFLDAFRRIGAAGLPAGRPPAGPRGRVCPRGGAGQERVRLERRLRGGAGTPARAEGTLGHPHAARAAACGGALPRPRRARCRGAGRRRPRRPRPDAPQGPHPRPPGGARRGRGHERPRPRRAGAGRARSADRRRSPRRSASAAARVGSATSPRRPAPPSPGASATPSAGSRRPIPRSAATSPTASAPAPSASTAPRRRSPGASAPHPRRSRSDDAARALLRRGTRPCPCRWLCRPGHRGGRPAAAARAAR
jgi:hypothetical protein